MKRYDSETAFNKAFETLCDKEADMAVEMTIRIENGAAQVGDGIYQQRACVSAIRSLVETWMATTRCDVMIQEEAIDA